MNESNSRILVMVGSTVNFLSPKFTIAESREYNEWEYEGFRDSRDQALRCEAFLDMAYKLQSTILGQVIQECRVSEVN